MRTTPGWQAETIDQRIERVIASVPELCPNCGGTGSIESVGEDGGDLVIEHTTCPVCHGYSEPFEDDE